MSGSHTYTCIRISSAEHPLNNVALLATGANAQRGYLQGKQ